MPKPDLYYQYLISDKLQNVWWRFMNIALKYDEVHYILHNFDVPVTSFTAVCTHRDIKVLTLLLKELISYESKINHFIDTFEKNKIVEISIEELHKQFECDRMFGHVHLPINYIIYLAKTLVGSDSLCATMFGKKYPLSNVSKHFATTKEAVTQAVFKSDLEFLETLHTTIEKLKNSYSPTTTSCLVEWLKEEIQKNTEVGDEDYQLETIFSLINS